MRILLIEPEKAPVVKEISGELKEMQEIVGGTIQAIYPFKEKDIALICNEEAKLIGLPANRALMNDDGKIYDVIHGTFFICGTSEDSFASLTHEQIERFTKEYSIPEMFIVINGKLICFPM